MNVDVVTLFPGVFAGELGDGIVARARRAGLLGVRLHDLRRWGVNARRQVDDAPFGGGPGMVLRPEPFFEAVKWIRQRFPATNDRVVLLSPQGKPLGHDTARRLATYDRLIVLSGRYEGIDERVREALVDEEISLADVVLTGGEIPALALIDAVARFVPGVLGNAASAEQDSFSTGLLDHPHYTRPLDYAGRRVPDILVSGDHAAVARWRRERAVEATRQKRPDMHEAIGNDSKCAEEARGRAQ